MAEGQNPTYTHHKQFIQLDPIAHNLLLTFRVHSAYLDMAMKY
jgi:hypothetical protein